jgi:hypothetical protein
MSLKLDVFDFTSYSDAGKGPKQNDSRSHTYCIVETAARPVIMWQSSVGKVTTFYDTTPSIWKNCVNNQQDALYRLIYYFKSTLHVLGDVFAHHQEDLTELCGLWGVYTQNNLHTSSSVSTYPRHQLAASWVNSTRYCKYIQVLMMMGGNITRNM